MTGPYGTNFKQITRKKEWRRKKRVERKVAKSVRAQCVARDGYCRVAKDGFAWDFKCGGPSQWAHLPDYTRAKTRGKPPEERHITQGSIMACEVHHDHLDGRRQPKLLVLGDADGELRWLYADTDKLSRYLEDAHRAVLDPLIERARLLLDKN